jgi:hypothetical protein
VINAGGVNSGGRAVAAVWINEKLKIWKGEPYERAMASFYLGLVYYIRHDYGNARAAFEKRPLQAARITPTTKTNTKITPSRRALSSSPT